jgi:hypothetical protein
LKLKTTSHVQLVLQAAAAHAAPSQVEEGAFRDTFSVRSTVAIMIGTVNVENDIVNE